MSTMTFTVRMDDGDVKDVDAHARKNDRSRNDFVKEAIAEKLAFEKVQTARIRRGLEDADAGRFADTGRLNSVLNKFASD
ncbi:MAG: ribbon-helix-helix protein, CopG family [Rhodospirillales bacterium]|jgi:predicted transcriptional regulator|nr:ribbon-helix-helix protein, CopG family [Rhodospirillales bacterium]MBT4039859.1 ribbon-helix-helix protein, CopG family [Rhodospirillales bacterium]MBT4628319.1 ribbon-helix-helix protein, CopG family [Rhodospirillales bacterium]MBT5350622.1 ribbon-helix-helix protein, CopG family [Rhodospirillales bacterium]MBT5521293.1 ribbon-helix-helix protein, CopG family [Rhodospirillales bacterium]